MGSREDRDADERTVHVDEDWKRAVAEEKQKERAEEEQTRACRAEAERTPLPEVTFQTFMAGLYTQALMALGELENPLTRAKETNADEAALLIDTIAMLQKKSEGNLTPDESSYVQSLLTDLRMRYVRLPAGAAEREEPPQEAP